MRNSECGLDGCGSVAVAGSARNALVDLRREAGFGSDAFGDAGEDGKREVAAVGTMRWAVGGVDLHTGDLRAAGFEFLEAVQVDVDFGVGRFLAAKEGEQALDHDRARSRGT